MASANPQQNTSATRLLYNEDNFEPYHLRLLAACVNEDSSNLDLLAEDAQNLDDPITNYINKYEANVLGADIIGHPPTTVYHVSSKSQIFVDPSKYGKPFIRDLFTHKISGKRKKYTSTRCAGQL